MTRSITLAELFEQTTDLPSGHDRLAVAGWAQPFGTDVGHMVRECQGHGVLEALAMELEQVLPALRFEESVRKTIPEYAWALSHMRDNPSPPNPELQRAVNDMRSRDSKRREAAHAWFDRYWAEHRASRVGRALALRPTPEMLAARIDELRAALDVDLMQRALDRRPHRETQDERENRIIAETLADSELLLRENDPDATAGLWGAVGGRVMRKLRAETAERYHAERRALVRRYRARGA